MKNALALAVFMLSTITQEAHAGVDFWHSNLVFAGQGACSAEFTFDSGLEDISKLDLSFNLQNKAGKTVAKDEIHLDSFGQSSATRYAQAFVESEQICDSALELVVTGATAVIDGKRVDLLKTKLLAARKFAPILIKVP